MAPSESALEDAGIAARQNEAHLFRIPNVCSVGVGYKYVGGERTDEIGVVVSVRRKAPLRELRGAVPREILGRDGRFVVTDVIEERPLVAAADFNTYRPLLAGTLIMGGGTLGGWAVDPSDFTRALLTNNHVFGSYTNGPTGPGAVVTQPGPGVADRIGYVKRYIPLHVGPDPNTVPVSAADAALATVDPDVPFTNLVAGTGGIVTSEGVEVIYERAAPQLGDRVLKRGFATELTRNGVVTRVGTTVDFPYPHGWARIANCFAVESTDGARFWDVGDSGSLILREAPGRVEGTLPALGLLFGGWTDGTLAFCSDINAIFAALEVSPTALSEGPSVTSSGADVRPEPTRGELDRTSQMRSKDRQVHRLRDVFRGTEVGEVLDELFTVQMPRLSQAVFTDPETYDLFLGLVRPWLFEPTVYEMLDREVDADSAERLREIVRRVSDSQPQLREQLDAVASLVGDNVGSSLRELLKAPIPPPLDRYRARPAAEDPTS